MHPPSAVPWPWHPTRSTSAVGDRDTESEERARLAETRRARGPGRVNLIGDHTDYNQGLALPMAIPMGVTVSFSPADAPTLTVASTSFDEYAVVPLDADPTTVEPPWARLVAAVASQAGLGAGGTVDIDSTLPLGSGLSSSAALSVALAIVFGAASADSDPDRLARLCQEAEHRIGVPIGLMDPLVSAAGRSGHAMLIDFDAGTRRHIRIPDDVEIVVVDSGQRRSLTNSAYAERVAECRAAAEVVGPLGRCAPDDLVALRDPVLARRARHVVTECARVRDTASALLADDLVTAGALLTASHRSLADDYAVSTPVLDDLVAALTTQPGVLGARMTGAGFGGCVVALTRPGAVDTGAWPTPAWRVAACDGALVGGS